MTDDLPYLKQVSRIKHQVLQEYLEPWSKILGSSHSALRIVDCFAGGGKYVDERGEPLPGSPVIALRLAEKYLRAHPSHRLFLVFVEQDHKTALKLKETLFFEKGEAKGLEYDVREEDAREVVLRLVHEGKEAFQRGQIVPTFFFVDPFGHPLPVDIMSEMLTLPKMEVLVNLMSHVLAMHVSNPKEQEPLDRLFGSQAWRDRGFSDLYGQDRDKALVDYFMSQVRCEYKLPLPLPFSPEDDVPGREKRTKFWLVHFSNHHRAALLMKHVMVQALRRGRQLRRTARGGSGQQLPLMEDEPTHDDLCALLVERFEGQRLTFEEIQVRSLDAWPFVESDYAAAVRVLAERGQADVPSLRLPRPRLGRKDSVAFL